jgi:hypothetical protein
LHALSVAPLSELNNTNTSQNAQEVVSTDSPFDTSSYGSSQKRKEKQEFDEIEQQENRR